MGGFVSFPASGVPWEALRAEMEAAKAADVAWRRGRSPAYVHFGGEDVLEVSKAAFDLFFTENALGRQAFPSLARFEREIVGMSLDLLGGPAGGAGSVTTGGTESIFLVVKAARDRLRRERPEVDVPEIVAARSAHPAFDKAAHCLGCGWSARRRATSWPTPTRSGGPSARGRR